MNQIPITTDLMEAMKMAHCFQMKGLAKFLMLIVMCANVTTSHSEKIDGFLNINYRGNSTQYEDPVTGLTWENDGTYIQGGNITYICLLRVHDPPFISSLEVRHLDSEGIMYSFIDSRKYLLVNYFRWNLGPAYYKVPAVRYPDDSYDRLWTAASDASRLNASLPINVTTSSKVNNVPVKVMADAIIWNTSTDFEVFNYKSSVFTWASPSLTYLVCYYWNMNITNDTGTLVTNVVLNDYPEPEMTFSSNVTNHITSESYPNNLRASDDQFFHISFDGILNAVEFFYQVLFDPSSKDRKDRTVLFIEFIKHIFKMTEWQGDPCTPVPYTNITCTLIDNKHSIDSLSLAGLSSSTRLLDFRSNLTTFYTGSPIANLLQQNSIGSVSCLLASEDNLEDLLLAVMWRMLLSNSSSKTSTFPEVVTLDMTHNDITVLSPPQLTPFIQSLNLSQNSFRGEIPSFESNNEGGYMALFTLNLSRNNFTSFPKSWGNWTTGLANLEVLDLSDNHLTGDLSSLNKLVEQNSLTIKEIYISNNNLTGSFSSGLYISNLTALEILNLSGNGINGLLDLTAWLGNLNTYNASSTHQLLSFVNNSISDVKPSAEVLQPTLERLMNNSTLQFNQSGILLGGNPYCENPKSQTQRYLCRSSTSEVVYATHRTKKSYALAVSLPIAGLLLLIAFCILFSLVWSLRAQVYTLRKVQQGKQRQEGLFLGWKQRLNICTGIARGLSYLHEELQPRIIHRDIKAANVLLDKDWNPKIADFGLAKSFLNEETEAQFTLLKGTRGYLAPEYVLEGQLTEKADVFSFGILVLEIISGRQCIDSKLPLERQYLKTWAEQLKRKGQTLDVLEPELRQNCPEDEATKVIDVALSCVQNDPKSRATMSEVVYMLLGNTDIIPINMTDRMSFRDNYFAKIVRL